MTTNYSIPTRTIRLASKVDISEAITYINNVDSKSKREKKSGVEKERNKKEKKIFCFYRVKVHHLPGGVTEIKKIK